MTEPLTMRQADASDLDRITSLLERNGLPTADVSLETGDFLLAVDDSTFVGTGGLEIYGPHALVRSVVVEESTRGVGYGERLYAALEEHATAHGVETAFLLTTTAREFFERMGFERISREAAPSEIQATTQFETFCPDSAVCLQKAVSGGDHSLSEGH